MEINKYSVGMPNALLAISIFSAACNDQPATTDANAVIKKEQAMKQDSLLDFGKRYAAAWSAQDAVAYAKFFTTESSLSVNDHVPSVGRAAIAATAQSYMTAFPDMLVTMDSLPVTPKGIEFHWTLTGTNTGPGGTGNKIHVSGVEILQLDETGLIRESKGSFDEGEYNRQLKEGTAK